ncbi:MAG TPA: hypothetical protein VKA53_05445, partial [Thermoanaerobaculia bacterium]|nr:hypothetical protein [Thermoanaerobaculia bacterium]
MAVMLYVRELRETDPATKGDLVYDAIEFDAVVRVVHDGQSQVTRHPVEASAKLSDHSVPEPRGIQLVDAVVSDFPLLLPGEKEATAAAQGGL